MNLRRQRPDYDRAGLDFQYSPSRSAKDAAGNLKRYADETRAAKRRDASAGRFDVPYGPGRRQRMDIYPASAAGGPSPVLIFIHGGFWQESSKEDAGFPAPAFVDAGVAYVALNYTLAPEARLQDIVGEIRAAVFWLTAHAAEFGGDPERLVVAGHSAGAYLAASLLVGPDAPKIAGLVPISGVYDLAPVAASYVNDALGMDAADVRRLDLVESIPLADIPVRIFVGGAETDEFRRQSAWLHDAWRGRMSDVSLVTLAGRDHFDILFDLSQPDGDIFRAAVGLAEGDER